MASQRAAASDHLFRLAILAAFVLTAPVLTHAEEAKAREGEDRRLLREVRLRPDPRRGQDEGYFQRFVFRTRDGKAFIGAYWREGGLEIMQNLDIFAVEKATKRPLARRISSVGLGGEVLAFHVLDIDGDGRDDLLLVHRTGGNIATTGVTALRGTEAGFSEIFRNAGSDALVYRERDQVRVMIKGKTSQKIWEYGWNPSKNTFEITRTLELLY